MAKRFARAIYSLKAGSQTLELGKRTLIMGIVNATPDSFSQDGLYKNPGERSQTNKALIGQTVRKVKKMIHEGADIVDIGGESTRPGAKKISVKEEINRVIPLIESLSRKIKIPISIDSYKPKVIQRALDAGATIVNNIKGVAPDKTLLKIIRDYDAVLVLMHIRGTPQTMQKKIKYAEDIVQVIAKELAHSVEKCLEAGIKRDKIMIDPGIGFGKTVEHNLSIINRLNELKILKRPILLGPSRKSFIGKVLDKDVNKRLNGTIASACTGILRGAHILRVHDVRPIKEAVLLTDAILNEAC